MKGIRSRVAATLVALLIGTSAQAAQTTFVAVDSTWKFLDDGSDQGGAWALAAFNDTSWPSGPAELGYGDGDEATAVSYGANAANKYVTTYFRQRFQVVGAAAYTSLLLRVKRDDGVVIYLNGTEVVRSNMPAGAVTFTTLASSAVGGAAELTFLEFSIAPGLLLEGANVLGAEIHQDAVTSSDISFAAELIGADLPVQIVRGPYLQSGTSTGVILRWRTNAAADSRVWYGTTPGGLTSTSDDPSLGSEHTVQLSGLTADTRYYYAVGTTAGQLVGNDAEHFFVTAPALGARRDIHLWALGDAGTATSAQRDVRNSYEFNPVVNQIPHLWLMLGDNAYSSGTDAEFENAVFDMYPRELQTSVLWPTLGNHDGQSADSATESGPYYDIFTLPRLGETGGEPSATEAYYAFDYGNVHFICLESYETDRSAAGAMMTWLEADLQAVVLRPTPPDWIVAFWHHPPYTKGSHDSDAESELIEMRQNALPILEDYGVDLVLTGHSHSYERTFLLDGHYGLSATLTGAMILDGGNGRPLGSGAYEKPTLGPAPHEGAVYVVAGSSGQTSGGSLNHPAMYTSLNKLGSVVLDIDRNVLDLQFLEANSGTPDSFRLVKGGPGQLALNQCPPTPRPSCRTAAKAKLLLKQGPTDDKDRVLFKWIRGSTLPAELGQPQQRTDYALCVYDQAGVLVDMDVAASPVLWTPIGSKGFRYRDTTASAEGAFKLTLKGAADDRASVLVRGRGTALPDPTLPATGAVTAQLLNSETGVCWGATFASTIRNDGIVLKAVTP